MLHRPVLAAQSGVTSTQPEMGELKLIKLTKLKLSGENTFSLLLYNCDHEFIPGLAVVTVGVEHLLHVFLQ